MVMSKARFFLFSTLRRTNAVILRLMAMAICVVSVFAEAHEVNDSDLKAVYLYRFAHLVDWQQTATTDIRHCFCSDVDNPVSQRLQDIVAHKPSQASFSRLSESLPGEPDCHIVYTTAQDSEDVARLRARFPGALLVGEGQQFIASGGMMAFIRVNNRIKPLINRHHLRDAPFSLRSQLLSIAVIDGEDNV